VPAALWAFISGSLRDFYSGSPAPGWAALDAASQLLPAGADDAWPFTYWLTIVMPS